MLEYFDTFIIGLTATPTAQTLGFFHGNLVQEYTHGDAVADGVNVGYDVYRIATKITEGGPSGFTSSAVACIRWAGRRSSASSTARW